VFGGRDGDDADADGSGDSNAESTVFENKGVEFTDNEEDGKNASSSGINSGFREENENRIV
jgi:hypothetical protein